MTSETWLDRIEDDLRKALPLWGLSPRASTKLLSHSENATFLAADAELGRDLVVRVHRPGYHSPAEVGSEIEWIRALIDEQVIDTPRPVSDLAGQYICSLELAGEKRTVVAFERAGGREPDPSTSLVDWFAKLGAINARLHRHSMTWRRPQGFARKTWNFDTMLGADTHWGDWRAAKDLTSGDRALLQRVVAKIAKSLVAFGADERRFGLIHADLRLANLLVEDDRLTVIDFDDSGFSWFLYDFASAVTFIEDQPNIPDLKEAWVAGYRSIRPLSREEADMLPTFMMLRRMTLMAWIASHSETDTARTYGPGYGPATAALGETYLR